jgi:lambda family phage tail tape measure protein
MSDIEAKVKASGRKMGQAMAPKLGKADSQIRAYYANLEKLQKDFNKVLATSNKRTIRLIHADDKRAAALKLRTQKALGASMASMLSKQSQAIIMNNARNARIVASQDKANAKAKFAASSEGIFRAAGIKSPHARLREIKALKLAQKDLNRELGRGSITRLQYNTILKDTHKRMNLLERGDVRARGALHRLIARTASLTFELTGAVFGLVTMGAALASPALLGIGFLKKLEDTKLGISGILLAMGSINHEMLTFEQASEAANEQVNMLAQDAIKLAGTLQDFTKSFQAVLAPGLAAGMSLSEIRKVSVAGTVAVKTIGLDARQIVQEIRDLVAGGIQAASSTLATSLGLTDRDIKAAKLSSEGLFKFLMKRLDGFRRAGLERDKTLAGKMEQTWEVFIRGMAQVSEPVFDNLKGLFDDILSRIADIDENIGTVTFKPEFIDGVKLWVNAINTGLTALKELVKLMWDFKKVMFVLIGAKIAKTLFGSMHKAAVMYHGILKGILVTELAVEAVRARASLSTGRLGPTVQRASKVKRGVAAIDAASMLGTFSMANLKKLVVAAGKLVIRVVGKLGLWGLAIWGIYEAGSAIWDAMAPVKKVRAAVQKTTEELKTEAAKAAEAKATGLSDTIAALQKLRFETIDRQKKSGQGVNTSNLDQGIAELISKQKLAETEAGKLAEANLTLSERIKRSGAAATAAKKSIAALGGEFAGAAKKVELEIQALVDLQNLQNKQLILEKKLKDGKLGAEAILRAQKEVTENKSTVNSLKMQLDLQQKIAAANLRVAISKKGSREKAQAVGELSKLKQLVPLLGRQSEIEKQLQGLAKEKDPNAAVLERKRTLKGLQQTNQERINFVKALDPAREAQNKFNAKLTQATKISDRYIISLRGKAAAQAAEISGGKTGLEAAETDALKEYGKAIADVLDKYTELRLNAKADISIIDQQEIDEVTRMSAAFVKAGVSLKEFYEIKGVQEQAEGLRKIVNISEDYYRATKDNITIRELEFSLIGKSGIEVALIRKKIVAEEKVAKIHKKFAEERSKLVLSNSQNVLFTLDAEKVAVDAITEAYKLSAASMQEDYDKRNLWMTGQTEVFNSYVSAAENSAEQAKGFYSSVFSSLESDMAAAFKSGELNFESFTKTILDGLLKIAMQKIIAGVVTSVVGGSVNSSGVEGVTAGSQQDVMLTEQNAGFAKGGLFDPSGVVAFAKGGVVSSPTTFPFAKGTGLMGEAGPEAIMPLSRTTSGDLGVKVSGGQGGGTVNSVKVEVNINSEGSSDTNVSGDEVDAKALGDSVGQLVQGELVKQMRPGGLLNRGR